MRKSYLIQNIISSSFGRNSQQNIETIHALLNEHLPPPMIVPLPVESLHLHLLNEVVGAQNIPVLVLVILCKFLRPECFASSGKADHHQYLAVGFAGRRHRTPDKAILQIQLTNRSKSCKVYIFKISTICKLINSKTFAYNIFNQSLLILSQL